MDGAWQMLSGLNITEGIRPCDAAWWWLMVMTFKKHTVL